MNLTAKTEAEKCETPLYCSGFNAVAVAAAITCVIMNSGKATELKDRVLKKLMKPLLPFRHFLCERVHICVCMRENKESEREADRMIAVAV